MSDSPSSSSGASSSSSSDSEDSPANRATRVPRGGPDGGPPRVLSEMDDAQLQEKMQRAQERLQGLDRHVEELRQRSEEHDARSRGKLPPEQTAEYLAKMKQLERKRQDLLKVEMDRAEEMRRRRAERGLPPIPVDTSAAGRAAMAERLEAEAKAGQARLDAYKRSKDWAQAETAHEARLKREREKRERERVAELARGGADHSPPPESRRGDDSSDADSLGRRSDDARGRDGRRDRPTGRDHRRDLSRGRRRERREGTAHGGFGHASDREPGDAPPPGYRSAPPPHSVQPPGTYVPGAPYHPGHHPGGYPGMYPPGGYHPHPPGMMGFPGHPAYPPAPYGMYPPSFGDAGDRGARDGGEKRGEASAASGGTPEYASKLKSQVEELQRSLESLLEVARSGRGFGGGSNRGGGDAEGGGGGGSARGAVPDLPRLPDEIKNDEEMKRMYAEHVRDMLKLQLDIGREARVVELERLRTEMLQLKDGILPADATRRAVNAAAANVPAAYPGYPPPPYAFPGAYGSAGPGPYAPGGGPGGDPGAAHSDTLGPAARAAAADMDQTPAANRPFTRVSGELRGVEPDGVLDSGAPSRRSRGSGGGSRAGPPQARDPPQGGPGPRALTPVVEDIGGESPGVVPPGVSPGEGDARSEYSIDEGGSRSDFDSGGSYDSGDGSSDSYYSDDDSERRLRRGLGREVPRRTVRVVLEGAGPMELKDSPARLVAALYEGHEPSRDAGGGAVRARGPLLEPSGHDRGGAARYKWRAKVTMRGVHVTAATKLVLELHAAQPPGQTDGFGREGGGAGFGGGPGGEEVVAWAHIPVLGPDGEPPSGLQVTPLLQLPLMLDAERTMRMEGSKVEVRVFVEPENLDREPTPPGTPRAGGGEAGGGGGRGVGGSVGFGGDGDLIGGKPAWLGGRGVRAQELEANRREDIPGVPRRAWREVRHVGAGGTGGRGEPFQTGDGLVFCVDAARFLPPNVTISRVCGRVISAANDALAPEFVAHAKLDSLAYSPRFHARLRFATGRWNNATATALLQIETIERETSQQRTVGYVVFPFFIDPNTGEPPTKSDAKGVRLKEGGFQLPVYAATAGSGSGFSLAEVLQRPKIPCASVLVRALVATRADTPANKQVPQYEDGAYDSGATFPTAVERRLYAHRVSQPGPPVREAMLELARRTFAPNVLSGMTESDLERWMGKRLERPQFANEKPLNYRRSDAYVPDLGFHVAVDGASRLSKAAFHVAVHSLFPPGTFYASKASDDVAFTQQPDIASSLVAPRWRDGFHARQHVIHEPNLVVVIDVRALVGRVATPVGWALLPVFEEGSEFIASGAFQLPLFQGPVPLPLMQDLVKGQAEGRGVMEVIQGWLEDKKVKFTPDKASVYARLLEDQRLGMLPEPAGSANAGVVFPPYVGEKLEPAFVKKSAGKPYAKNIPRGTLAEEYVAENNALVAASLGLPFVRGGGGFGFGAGRGGDEYSESGYSSTTFTTQTAR